MIRKLICLMMTLLFSALMSSSAAEWLQLRQGSDGQRPEFRMLEHNATGDRFEMSLPGIELSGALLDGKRWDRVEIYGGGFELDVGKPEVPHVTRMIAIPATAGVRVTAKIVEERIISGISLMPAQGIAPDEGPDAGRLRHWIEESYQRDNFYPETIAIAGEPALMRDVRIVPIRINPVRYNPVKKELAVAHRIEVQVSYEGTDLRNAAERPVRAISPSWGELMRSSIVNFDEVIDVDEDLMGSYIVICENDASLVDIVESLLLDWKRRIGHQAVLETYTPGASNYTLKAIIQDAYDNWEVPPEYVLLVGDDNGDYVLPGWSYYVGDHPYAQLAGNDILADVAVGRMPAENLIQAIAIINKVLWYEKQPYT